MKLPSSRTRTPASGPGPGRFAALVPRTHSEKSMQVGRPALAGGGERRQGALDCAQSGVPVDVSGRARRVLFEHPEWPVPDPGPGTATGRRALATRVGRPVWSEACGSTDVIIRCGRWEPWSWPRRSRRAAAEVRIRGRRGRRDRRPHRHRHRAAGADGGSRRRPRRHPPRPRPRRRPTRWRPNWRAPSHPSSARRSGSEGSSNPQPGLPRPGHPCHAAPGPPHRRPTPR